MKKCKDTRTQSTGKSKNNNSIHAKCRIEKNYRHRNIFMAILFFTFPVISFSQIIVNNNMTAAQLVQLLVGNNGIVTNVTTKGSLKQMGKFTGTSNLGITTGVTLATGDANVIIGPNNVGNKFLSFTGTASNADAELSTLVTKPIFDVSAIEFDFTAYSDSVKFRYVFGSEEYPEYVCSEYNDVFGFFLTGPNPGGGTYTNKNIAMVPNQTYAVTINTINGGSNGTSPCVPFPPFITCPTCALGNSANYVNNTGGTTIQFDGFTKPLYAREKVVPCGTYHMKIAIADVNDDIYDSGVFIEAGSFNVGSGVISAPATACISSAAAISYVGTGTATAWTFQGGTPATANGNGPHNVTWNTLGAHVITASTLIGTCTASLIDTINVQSCCAMTASINTSTDVSCNGGSNGSAIVSTTNATPPVTYTWSTTPPVLAASATNLSMGSYTVTVKDAINCIKTATILINEPAAFILTPNHTDAMCGNANGSVGVSVTGGTPGYNYLWNTIPAQNTATASNVAAGTYSLQLIDSKSCTANTTVTVNNIPGPTASILSHTNVSCNGSNDGTATASGLGGTPGYIYLWSTVPLQTGATATNLSAGTYTVTVKDAGNCQDTAMVVVTQPSVVKATINAHTNVSCFNGNNGTASVVPSGGTAGYSISWNTTPVQSMATVVNLTAGTYTVTVSDGNSCQDTAMVIISQPAVLNATINAQTNVSCFNGSNGTAGVLASGGTTPYSYLWNTIPPQAGISATNLSALSYIVTVSDSHNCIDTVMLTITQPAILNAGINNHTNATCFGNNNGTASVTATGGTFPYSYLWNTTPAQNATVAGGLIAGTYVVTVTDFKNCTDTAMVVITQPTAVNAIISSKTNTSCFGSNDGSASVFVSGGTPGYSYLWNTTLFQTTATAVNLFTGTYIVMVKDTNNCMDTAIVVISQPSQVTATINSHTNVSCFSGSDGTAIVVAAGGSGGYNYLWNTSPMQAATTAFGLAAGTYAVAVMDINSCLDTAMVVITEPTALNAVVNSHVNVSCFGGNTGSAISSANGGTQPYTYSWNTIPATLNSSVSNLAIGTYTIQVKDLKNCIDTAMVTIIQPAQLLASIASGTSVSCHGGSNGNATASATGGVPSYSYTWNTVPVQNSLFAQNLSVGSYQVSVKDANNCQSVAVVIISEPSLINANINSHSNASCNGYNDGSASVAVSGGTPGYNYLWNTIPQQTKANAVNLTAGVYTVFVADTNNCVDTAMVNITEPPTIHASINTHVNILCNGNHTGLASANVTGGTPVYSYLWSTQPPQFSPNIQNLAAGSYIVTVKDSHQCADTAIVIITEPPPLVSGILAISNYNGYGISCFNSLDGNIQLTVSGGKMPYSYSWSNGAVTQNLSALGAGNYDVTVTDANGCTSTSDTLLNRPAELQTSHLKTDVSCFGYHDGEADLNAIGGVMPYTYLWSNLSHNKDLDSVSAGTYFVNVIDKNNCVISDSLTINQPAVLEISTSENQLICKGANAVISGQATGGTNPYTYFWNSLQGNSSENVSPLVNTVYNLEVIDAHGCKSNKSAIFINVRPDIIMTLYADRDSVCPGEAVNISANINGGDGGPYYLYNPQGVLIDQPYVAYPLTSPVNYSLTAKDDCGTIGKDTIQIHVLPKPAPYFTSDVLSGCIPLTISFNPQQAEAGATYLWEFNENSAIATSQSPVHVFRNAGSYDITLTMTNKYGCNNTNTVAQMITAFPLPDPRFSVNPEYISILNPVVEFSNFSSGATSYLWSFGDGDSSDFVSPIHNYRIDGHYKVTLVGISEHGCKDTIAVPLIVHNEITFYAPTAFSPDMNGVNDVFNVVGHGIDPKNFTLLIYNRWGENIYTTNDMSKGWDGRANGDIVQSGSYVWMVVYKDVTKIDHQKSGQVTLIR